jgi:hypothetical protein
VSTISAEDAFRVLAKWSEERRAIQVVLAQSERRRVASVSVVNKVLPQSQNVLLTLPDENGADIVVTVNLAGAEWETGAGVAGAAFPELEEMNWARWVMAIFPNGNRYVFGEASKPQR